MTNRRGSGDSGGETSLESREATTVPVTGLADRTVVTGHLHCVRCGQEADPRPMDPDEVVVSFLCRDCHDDLIQRPPPCPGYRLVRELGRGGGGVVFLALHEVLGVERALKWLVPGGVLTEREQRRMIREAREQARLTHPNIVMVHDVHPGEASALCIAMEYVDGASAAELLRAAGGRGLEPDPAIRIVSGALQGLEYAHRHGIVHRDVKDSNIMVQTGSGGDPVPKLMDFGLAKPFATAGLSGLTRTGEVRGTIPFMPPEQVVDFRDIGITADVYSMGVTLYRLLTGQLPHDYPRGVQPLAVVLEHNVVPLLTRKPDLPSELAEAVECALRREPSDRYPSADAMRQALLALPS
jgi:serine/threonine-protein kinase